MSDFISLVQANGVLGLIVGFVVLVLVFGLSKGGVVVTGPQKQAANVILSILLSGLSILNPENKDALVAAIASIGSALVYELIKYIGSKAQASIKARAKAKAKALRPG